MSKFQLTEIGQFPMEWSVLQLKDIGDIITGSTPKTSDKGNYGGKYLFVSPVDMGRGKYIRESDKTLTKKGFSSSRAVPKGSVLVTCIGSTIGKVGVSSIELSTNQQINSVVCHSNHNNEFIYYAIDYNFRHYSRYISNQAVPIINKSLFSSFPIQIPSYKEQQKIAAILSSVDEAIEKTEQIIEQTETVKKGLMQEFFTKGIGHTEYKVTPVGTIPDNWIVLKFNDVFDRITTKNTVDNQNVLTISGEHGLISQLDYFNKSVSSKNLKNYIYLEKNDFAYNKSYSNGYPLGAIKRLERYDVGVVSTLYICFRLKEQFINGFFKHYFDSGYWNRQVYSIAPEGGRSHGLLNVGVKDFFEILIPVPPVEEQKRIKTILNSIDQKKIIEKRRLENLKSIKQGLMQQLLTGKVRVNVDDREGVTT